MKLSDEVFHSIHAVITIETPVTVTAVCSQISQTSTWPVPCLEDTSESEASPVDNHEVLSKSNAQKLRQDLIDYRLSLYGSGRSCVGGVTLATGFSIQLIDIIVGNALCLTSVERVIMDFPVFSAAHAQVIYNIVQKYHQKCIQLQWPMSKIGNTYCYIKFVIERSHRVVSRIQ